MPTRVYKFGLRPPTENETLVRETMRGANTYRNTLVIAERGRRDLVRSLHAMVGDLPSLEAAYRETEASVEAAALVIKSAKSRAAYRKESVKAAVTPEMSEAFNKAKEGRAKTRKALSDARRALRENLEIARSEVEIQDLYHQYTKEARGKSEIFWGTYLSVEAAHEQSCRNTPLYEGAEASNPRFQRFRGEGQIGVQLQGGMTISRLLSGTDNRLRLLPREAPASSKRDPNSRNSQLRRRMDLWVRVASEGRDPVWAKFPMVWHRDFPENAQIQWVKVNLRKEGPREVWSVDFTLRIPEIEASTTPGRVAFHLGWRQKDDGSFRVATYRADGVTHELALPLEIIEGIRFADSLRSIRDREFNAALATLIAFLRGLPEVPLWIRQRTVRRSEAAPSSAQAIAYLAHWHSFERLASLCRAWAENRFEGDAEVFEALEGRQDVFEKVDGVRTRTQRGSWRRQDRHLWDYEAGQRNGALRRRKDFYRQFAAKLASTYGTVIIPEIDHSVLARRPSSPEEAHIEAAASNRFVASISELSDAVQSAFSSRGGTVLKVSGEHITQECHGCHTIEAWDSKSNLRHECTACGLSWDQDDNAVRLCEQRGSATPPPDSADPAKPEKKGSKWDRAKAGRVEKLARIGIAREDEGKAAE